jgi:predicted ester cyclase
MTSEAQKATTRRWIVGIWNEGKLGLIDELAVGDQYTYQAAGQEVMRGQQFKGLVNAAREAFPDLQNAIESQVSEGETVVTRGMTRGTQRGTFAGVAPTGRTIEVPWVIFTSFQSGRIVADWEIYDALGMMTQLEGISAGAQAT